MSRRQSKKNGGMAVDQLPDPKPPISPKEEEEEDNQREEKIFFSLVFSSNRRLWAFCLAFRLLNSLLVQTYFVPDEHWQALEVAHRISFGYGHLTWEWKAGIRSYLHPLIFALLYKILAFLHLDTPWFMMKAPRLLQSVFSSVSDVYLYKLSRLIFDECIAQCALSCWFMFFCINRTLSNSLETVLTVVGLFYWLSAKASPRKILNIRRKMALFIATITCAIRPTSAITWLYVGLMYLFQTHDKLKFLFLDVIPIGVLVFIFSCLLDRWMYGSWILVPINFIKFNFLSSGGDYYGTHKWHWYFTEGFPAMLFTFLPFSVHGIYKSKEWRLFGLIIWVLGIYSILGHKEFRFVLPVLPIALIFSGYSIAAISSLDLSDHKRKRQSYIRRPSKLQLVIFFLLATNLPVALYFSLVHQRGSEDVMSFLANEAREGKVRSVLFLMHCHATPYYSSVHVNVPMRFLDCSPSNGKGVLNESDQFMMDPVGFAVDALSNWPSPSHIVLFDSQERQCKELLVTRNFIEVRRYFHAHFKVDRDLQASVVVYALPEG